jgi:hypothetical protein
MRIKIINKNIIGLKRQVEDSSPGYYPKAKEVGGVENHWGEIGYFATPDYDIGIPIAFFEVDLFLTFFDSLSEL